MSLDVPSWGMQQSQCFAADAAADGCGRQLDSAARAGFQETPETEAMLRRHLPVKPAIELEDWNRFAAMFDMDGMSWSDRQGSDARCSAQACDTTPVDDDSPHLPILS